MSGCLTAMVLALLLVAALDCTKTKQNVRLRLVVADLGNQLGRETQSVEKTHVLEG